MMALKGGGKKEEWGGKWRGNEEGGVGEGRGLGLKGHVGRGTKGWGGGKKGGTWERGGGRGREGEGDRQKQREKERVRYLRIVSVGLYNLFCWSVNIIFYKNPTVIIIVVKFYFMLL